MPSTYAHLRFGNDVYERLEGRARDICGRFRGLYSIGLHGPDILFYYDALHRNPVNQAGLDIHGRPGKDFFGPVKELLKEDTERATAYMYGFACHFALDSEAHPYIEEYIHSKGVTHTAIEGDFDRELLRMDGKNPRRTYLAGHIEADDRDIGIMSRFFPGITSEQIEKSLEEMRAYNRLLVAPGPIKRMAITRILKRTGNYESMIGLVLKNSPDRRCLESNRELMRIYSDSVELAVRLIGDLEMYVDGTLRELPSRFDRTFSIVRSRKARTRGPVPPG